MKKFGSKSGFTLVELIVVIAILGILAGIAVPAYSGYISKANEAADLTQLDAIKTAAIFAYTDEAVKENKDTTVTEITVNAGGTISVTGATGVTLTNAVDAEDIKPYYDLTGFAFKSGATSATWDADDQSWTLND